jgi:predicted nucleic acid-binding protein
MIVLDTNVVSELMRDEPNPTVGAWVDRQAADQLALTAITIAEILYGIRLLSIGRRRSTLDGAFARFLEQGFRSRILHFDGRAADHYARIVVERQRSGRRLETLDAMIVGIALAQGAQIATRDTADFEGCGVQIFNPWI